jgi:hypothetical protein
MPPRNSAGFCGGGQGLSWAVKPRKEEEEEEEEEASDSSSNRSFDDPRPSPARGLLSYGVFTRWHITVKHIIVIFQGIGPLACYCSEFFKLMNLFRHLVGLLGMGIGPT